MTKQIQITDEVYVKLADMKRKYRADSFTKLLKRLTRDYTTRDLLAAEISEAYDELKDRVQHTTLNGRLGSIIELMRIITYNVARSDPDERGDRLQEVERMLRDVAITTSSWFKKQSTWEERGSRKV